MDNKSKDILELFVSNAQTIRKEFTRHNIMTKRLAALLYAQKNKAIDCEAIKQSYKMMNIQKHRSRHNRGKRDFCMNRIFCV